MNREGITASTAIMSSKINYQLKFMNGGKNQEPKFKKAGKNWQTMSKIHQEGVSKIIKQSIKEEEARPVKRGVA